MTKTEITRITDVTHWVIIEWSKYDTSTNTNKIRYDNFIGAF